MGLFLIAFFTTGLLHLGFTADQPNAAPRQSVTVLEIGNVVQVQRAGSTVWDPAYVNQALNAGDRIRTGERSRAAVQMRDLSIVRLNELSILAFPPPEPSKSRFQLLQGLIYFFNRSGPGEAEVDAAGASAVVRGTEFTFEVSSNGVSTLRLIDGKIELSNPLGRVDLSSGQSAEIHPNEAPRQLPALQANPTRDLQWFLYYPAILVPDDLGLTPEESVRLEPVLTPYKSGDLRTAATNLPAISQDSSAAAFLLRAALEISLGRIEPALRQLDQLPQHSNSTRIASALRLLVQAVRDPGQLPDSKIPENPDELLATEWMVQSVVLQARRDLEGARKAARFAAKRATGFGFAQTRLAEMEFSFAGNKNASKAVETALELSPKNAQAHALRGFLLSSRLQIDQAIAAFDTSIAIDPGLANGWLGRGLCLIRRGDLQNGRLSLQMAAAMEPNRAILRSYLAKAFDAENNDPKAVHELELSKGLDPLDPTSWLYSALLNQNSGRVNQAVRDLLESIRRNENRAVYRSRLLLDQDRAVRSASLANVFKDAGFNELAVHEAGTAVSSSYSAPSAHLFLAQSHLNADRINLRNESARVGEFLTANLLAPGGAAPYSSTLSQQEYSSMLERDGLGLFSQTEYRSNGRWSESAATHFVSNGSSFALDGFKLSDPGYRPNNRLDSTAASFQYRQQAGATDTLFFQPFWSATQTGDLVEHYDPAMANTRLRIEETQSPILLVGWRHDWSPGNHTLFLFTHLKNELDINNPQSRVPILSYAGGAPFRLYNAEFDEISTSRFSAVTAEIQHLFERERLNGVFGIRIQEGQIETDSRLQLVSRGIPGQMIPQGTFAMSSPSDRIGAYGIQSLQLGSLVQITAGLTYDRMGYPVNFRSGLVTSKRETTERLSPKAGFILTPHESTTFRFAYAPSLGGVGFDQSFRLEPTQISGINQAYRSLIPESVAGSSSAEWFDIWGCALVQKVGRSAWISLQGDWLESTANREIAMFEGSFGNIGNQFTPTTRNQWLDFQERSITANLHLLLGRDWAGGLSHKLGDASLKSGYGNLAEGLSYWDLPSGSRSTLANRRDTAILEVSRAYLHMNHPCGFFMQTEAVWTRQELQHDLANLPDEDLWQFNAAIGYRFYKRRAELRLGVLNITDADYRIHPISILPETTRQRTLTLGFKWRL